MHYPDPWESLYHSSNKDGLHMKRFTRDDLHYNLRRSRIISPFIHYYFIFITIHSFKTTDFKKFNLARNLRHRWNVFWERFFVKPKWLKKKEGERFECVGYKVYLIYMRFYGQTCKRMTKNIRVLRRTVDCELEIW